MLGLLNNFCSRRSLTGKIEQHDAEKNREQALARHSRQRKDDSERDQQDAENVFTDDLGSVKGGTRS